MMQSVVLRLIDRGGLCRNNVMEWVGLCNLMRVALGAQLNPKRKILIGALAVKLRGNIGATRRQCI